MSSRIPEEFFDESDGFSNEYDESFLTEEWLMENLFQPGAEPVTESLWYEEETLSSDRIAIPSESFVPEKYEPRYAYPLIVWLHSAADGHPALGPIMNTLSPQNYLALSFKVANDSPVSSRSLATWPTSDRAIEKFLTEIHQTVCQLGSFYHVHTERIYLAGFEDAGSTALRLFLKRPDWFGGAAAFGTPFPESLLIPERLPVLDEKRILVGQGIKDPVSSIADSVCWTRIFKQVGANLTTKLFDGQHELTPEMLKYVNEWLMNSIYADNMIY
ncbi:MAG: hypothetical protein KDA65_05490 [Planctomycetaceae bacterium]|nr:hypothetical protein [Planctomycetaceae bacterium]